MLVHNRAAVPYAVWDNESLIVKYSMHRLAIDVGIQNLAFCLMKNDIIAAWGNGSLDMNKKDYRCETCGLKARFVDDTDTPFCKRHVPKPVLMDDEKKLYRRIPSVRVLRKMFPAQRGLRKSGDWIDFLRSSFCLPIVKPRFRPSFEELYHAIMHFVEIHDDVFRKAKIILIENQPSLVNPKMKTVQVMLYTIFKTRYPRAQLTLFNPRLAPRRLAYTQRKRFNEERTRKWLNDHHELKWLHFFEEAKKKSDLADALCTLLDDPRPTPQPHTGLQ